VGDFVAVLFIAVLLLLLARCLVVTHCNSLSVLDY